MTISVRDKKYLDSLNIIVTNRVSTKQHIAPE